MSAPSRTGVLLVNLGTPDAPTTPAVRRYLKEFLSDPDVIDLPGPARWLLVRLLIVPFRSPRSAAAYRSIWTPEGSPLLVHSRALLAGLRARLPRTPIELAMRYGRPGIRPALERLVAAGCRTVRALALYPQEARSTTGSTRRAVDEAARTLPVPPRIEHLPVFHHDRGFLDAWAQVARESFEEFSPDHVLFSFHGLPERHVLEADASGVHCLRSPDCCEPLREENRGCYRAQCYATARAIASRLDLEPERVSVAFQSRLGRTPWIRPYTDVTIRALGARGTRRLAVLCPAFVADCLETLEEIGLRGAETFRATGGGELHLVPSLNAHPAWVEALAALLEAPAHPAADSGAGTVAR